MPTARPQKIHVYHTTAPTCFWSWGYEAVFNRLPLVYGNQVDVHLLTSCVYDDFEDYLKHYEMTFKDMINWTKEGIEIMGVPLATDLRRERVPKSMMPATFAVIAAHRQGPGRARGSTARSSAGGTSSCRTSRRRTRCSTPRRRQGWTPHGSARTWRTRKA